MPDHLPQDEVNQANKIAAMALGGFTSAQKTFDTVDGVVEHAVDKAIEATKKVAAMQGQKEAHEQAVAQGEVKGAAAEKAEIEGAKAAPAESQEAKKEAADAKADVKAGLAVRVESNEVANAAATKTVAEKK